MSKKIMHINEGALKQEFKELVRHSVEGTLKNVRISQFQKALPYFLGQLQRHRPLTLYVTLSNAFKIP